MSGRIEHEWNGTVLTITSDSGTSSMDLQGPEGDQGCRGPQGPAGVVIDESGTILSGYATLEYVDEAILNAEIGGGGEINLSNYATKKYVDEAVANVDVDLTDYALKSDIPSLEGYATKTYVDNAIAGSGGGGSGGSGGTTDLSNYYTKTEVNNLITNSLTGYATQTYVTGRGYQTEAQVNALINNALGVIENGSY